MKNVRKINLRYTQIYNNDKNPKQKTKSIVVDKLLFFLERVNDNK